MLTRVWHRLDVPGIEFCRVSDGLLEGEVIVVEEGRPASLRYRIECDAAWRTRSAHVAGFANGQKFEATFAPGGLWIDGCVDVDLGFTPSTNTLPIRRLALRVGESAAVSAVWLRFPALTVERLDQTYTRLAEHVYRYESATGFSAELQVDDDGLVTRYGSVWDCER